jgi:hypothetical protein
MRRLLPIFLLAVGILGPSSAAAQESDDSDVVSFFATTRS